MNRRLLVNDMLSALPDHRTFWNDLQDWFSMTFVGGNYDILAELAEKKARSASLIVRNASYFPPISASVGVPTVSLLQDIFEDGPQREMQELVVASSKITVFNSAFTAHKYEDVILEVEGVKEADGTVVATGAYKRPHRIIPLPVDFSLFEPGNAMGLQQALSLPDGCVCWIGASEGAAGEIKGFGTFLAIVRANPDLPFVAVFKDKQPLYGPPNLRMYTRLTHEELVKIIGACKVGLCTSRTETQHLAGIEMGACGLPMVAPEVGTYWKRKAMPGALIHETTLEKYSGSIRFVLKSAGDPQQIRDYWKKEFDIPVVKSAWTSLIKEVEG